MTPFAPQLDRIVALGVALVLLVAGCGGLRSQVSQQFTQARRAQVSYHDGLARYEAQDYRGAIPLFERALANDPTFDEAEASLAWSYYHVGNYPQATRHFRQALARQPGIGWAATTWPSKPSKRPWIWTPATARPRWAGRTPCSSWAAMPRPCRICSA
jgi:tetratricopeptide (TPR) repeat protein